MTYAISGDCCADASCVAVCPMNCIHPSPGEPGFGTTDGLFIDPRTCIDCGACADICPVDAAKPADRSSAVDVQLNASYYKERPVLDGLDLDTWEPPRFDRWSDGPRRVVVVGAGPAGMYATRELLQRSTAEVTVFDRLPVVGGLARYGVAPDHPVTKQIVETFERIVAHPRVRWRPSTSVSVDDLEGRYDAVVHASGAYQSRRLGIPGELAADEIVAWYNNRPGARRPDLKGPRAVVVGNGNVALDLARLLTSFQGPDRFTEVVVLGRRGPESAAYTASAYREVEHTKGIALRYNTTPVAWDGRALTTADGDTIAADTLITAIGFTGRPIPGLPFDETRGVVPNDRGAVIGKPGHFVTGWIKRGAQGGIGVNKACAQETVRTLLTADVPQPA
ncbi:FAD-dependent oxidoreductase [Kribbella italica]|uniref:ferredoxin--NADP(+) reductase n=1 Tax=Kribbella italica TaxID=1540520 RepID=A0A7W9J7E1_9ACTN|nr:FAD-dependent oxidoreductase [Kribbella italica]MBB5837004.1 ferredoxin--NADP+ reductase [Kribbella italica]